MAAWTAAGTPATALAEERAAMADLCPRGKILCTVAAAHLLEVGIDGNVVMVRRRAPAK